MPSSLISDNSYVRQSSTKSVVVLQEIRFAFSAEKLSPGKERLLVSVAVPAGMDYIDQGFDVPLISQ